MISPKRLEGRYPKRTFKGRDRVSLVPRWIMNWVTTGVVIYFMSGYIFRMMGFEGWVLDPFKKQDVVTVSFTSTPVVVPNNPVVPPQNFHASSDGSPVVAITSTPVAIVTQQQPTYTPLPTYTPYPTQRPFFGTLLAVGYSYYWPPYGPPNCSVENWHDNFCEDTTASGLRWTQYIGHGVSVPLQWRENIPLGSTVRVHSPAEMIGDYVVLDYCGGCIKPEGHIYFDFLDNRARLNWTVPMLVEIILP